jgi:hypothetical protein
VVQSSSSTGPYRWSSSKSLACTTAQRGPPSLLPPPAAAGTLIWLLDRYLAPAEAASPLEVQKLLYFLQEAGEPLGLRFGKHRYGPYADAARHAVTHIEDHYVTGFGDGTGLGDVRPLPGAIEEAEAFLADHPETRSRYSV